MHIHSLLREAIERKDREFTDATYELRHLQQLLDDEKASRLLDARKNTLALKGLQRQIKLGEKKLERMHSEQNLEDSSCTIINMTSGVSFTHIPYHTFIMYLGVIVHSS